MGGGGGYTHGFYGVRVWIQISMEMDIYIYIDTGAETECCDIICGSVRLSIKVKRQREKREGRMDGSMQGRNDKHLYLEQISFFHTRMK